MTIHDPTYTREQDIVRGYLEGARIYQRQTTALSVLTYVVLTLLGVVLGLTAPIAYNLIMTPPEHGVMDTVP